MEGQTIHQAIVIALEKLNPNRVTDKLALFNPDGSPYVSEAQVALVQQMVDEAIAELVGDAPEALDKLNELASAMGDDPNFSVTILNDLAEKQDKDALVISVMDHGAVGDGVADDTAAIWAAIVAAGSNGRVFFPDGKTFLVTPDVVTGICFPLVNPGVSFDGHGATIKVANGVGNYVGIFVGNTVATDLSGTEFHGITFDLNHANNTPPNEAALQGAMGPYTRRRNPIHIETGKNIKVLDCVFRNAPRQGIFLGKPGAVGSVKAAVVSRCHFLTDVDGVGDWDTTACFILGDDCKIIGNHFEGHGTNYYLSRTSIQMSGSRAVVAYNTIEKYFRGPVVGNASIPEVADGITVIANTMTDVNCGIEVDSLSSGALVAPSVGARNVLIMANNISTNKLGYTRDSVYAASPTGISLFDGNNLGLDNVQIIGNNIFNISGYTLDGGPGIDLSTDVAFNVVSRNIIVDGNAIINSSMSGIQVALTGVVGLMIRDNTILNPGCRAGAAASHTVGIRVTNSVTLMTLERNAVIDDRVAHLVTSAIYVSTTALASTRITPGRFYVADGTVLPRVVLNNVSSAAAVVIEPAMFGVLVADEPRLNNDVVADVPGLSATLLKGQTYLVELILKVDGATTGDLKLGFTTPVGVTGFWAPLGPTSGAASSTNTSMNDAPRDWNVTATFGTPGIGTPIGVIVRGIIKTTTAAGGVLQVQAAQGTIDAANTTKVFANSHLRVTPIDTLSS